MSGGGGGGDDVWRGGAWRRWWREKPVFPPPPTVATTSLRRRRRRLPCLLLLLLLYCVFLSLSSRRGYWTERRYTRLRSFRPRYACRHLPPRASATSRKYCRPFLSVPDQTLFCFSRSGLSVAQRPCPFHNGTRLYYYIILYAIAIQLKDVFP